jgi:hypothetical protein
MLQGSTSVCDGLFCGLVLGAVLAIADGDQKLLGLRTHVLNPRMTGLPSLVSVEVCWYPVVTAPGITLLLALSRHYMLYGF